MSGVTGGGGFSAFIVIAGLDPAIQSLGYLDTRGRPGHDML
jgi:hypothetical protein